MVSRVRTRVDQIWTGHVWRRIGGVVTTDSDFVVNDTSRCSDDTHPYPYTASSNLDISHLDRSGFRPCTGTNKSGPTDTNYTLITGDYLPEHLRIYAYDHAPISGVPSDAELALTVLGRTNPNRGEADIGQDIIDGWTLLPAKMQGILDLKPPGQHHFDGDDADAIGNAIIDGVPWWQFGIKPIIDDIAAMERAKELIQQRLRELSSLFKKGGLRRRVNLGTYSAVDGSLPGHDVTVENAYFLMSAKFVRTTTMTVWGSVRWQPVGWSFADFTDEGMEAQVRRILFGLGLSPKEIWDKLPWSWLLNSFTSIGQHMAANKANLKCVPGPVCIMKHKRTEFTYSPGGLTSWVKGGFGTVVRESKLRTVVPTNGLPSSFFRNPYLGPGASASLGAIFARWLGQ